MRLDKEEILDKEFILQIQLRTQSRILELEKDKKETLSHDCSNKNKILDAHVLINSEKIL